MDACAYGVECRGAGAVTCNNMLTVAALVDSVGTLPFQTFNQTNFREEEPSHKTEPVTASVRME